MDPFTAGMIALAEFFRYLTAVENNLTPEQHERIWAVGNRIMDALEKLKPKAHD